jgi:hypothetical protein
MLFCDHTDLLKMTDAKEQQICIKSCFKLSKTAAETHKMLKEASGNNVLGLTQTYEWLKHFKTGWMSVDKFWTTFNRNHDRICGKIVIGYTQDRKGRTHNVKLSYRKCQ